MLFSSCNNCNRLVNINQYSRCNECTGGIICLNCRVVIKSVDKKYIVSKCKKCSKIFNKELFYCKIHNNCIKTPLSDICNECVEFFLSLPQTDTLNLPLI
jgi:hypothetical protein